MHFVDAVSVVGTPRLTGDGYLIANARSVRTGIQLYSGAEVGMADKAVVRVYRPPEEVFANDSLRSFSHAPITIDHPAEPVTAQNWRRLSVGEVSTAAQMDGEWVSLPLILKDSAAIDGVSSGKRQLSAGYTCKLDATPGETPDKQQYDAVQRNIRINHLALVDRARAGPRACIGDAWTSTEDTEPSPNTEIAMKSLTIDGHTVEMSDAAIVAVSALQTRAAALVADNLKLTADAASAATAHGKAIEAKDGELGALKAEHATALQAKDGEIAALKAQIPDAAKLDALAAGRADLIAQARRALGDGFVATGKPDVEIRRAVVAKALGDEAAKAMSDAEVGGAFKIVAAGKAGADPIRTSLSTTTVGDASDPRRQGFADMCSHLDDAWKAQPAA